MGQCERTDAPPRMHSERAAAGTRLKTAESPDKQQRTSVFVELEGFLKQMLMLHLRPDAVTPPNWPGVY